MNMIYTLCIIFIIMQSVGLKATAEELFLRGNKLYKEQQFEQALATYQEIPDKGAAVWYGMGSCAYHKGDYQQALSFWVAAERGASWSLLKNIDCNREIVEKKLSEQEKKETLYASLTTIQKIISPFSLLMFQILFLIVLIFGIWFIIFFAKNRPPLITVWIIILLLIGVGMSIKYSTIKYHMGIIKESSVPLYAGPHEHYHVLGNLNQSATVIVYEIKDAWCKIQFQQLIGWIRLVTLTIV